MAKPESKTYRQIFDQLTAENEDALVFDGYEDALIGICYQFGRPPVASYDYGKCISILMKRDGMSHEEAVEFFEFNTLGSGLGENTPVFTELFT